MQPVHVNILALVVAVVAKGIVGAVWYSPALFLKHWMQLTGVSNETMKAGMAKSLTVETIGNLVMAFILVHAIRYAGATTIAQGLGVGLANWLGFILTIGVTMAMYEQRPMKLVAINAGYQLVGILLMGAILAVWV
jgi:uncharacterized protein DUF1761